MDLKLIKRMNKVGFYYDVYSSYKGNYQFNYDGMVMPMQFKTIKEIKEYLRDVITD